MSDSDSADDLALYPPWLRPLLQGPSNYAYITEKDKGKQTQAKSRLHRIVYSVLQQPQNVWVPGEYFECAYWTKDVLGGSFMPVVSAKTWTPA